MTINRALISVTDKAELYELVIFLKQKGIEIISTGGTKSYLQNLGFEVTSCVSITNFPEIMGGRIKTLHPKIHGGILGRRGIDAEIMEEYKIPAIDLIVVNLYNFQGAISNNRCTIAAAIEQIDIGGPAMLRSAAKNYEDVVVLCDPEDYSDFMIEYESTGDITYSHRLRYAQKVYAYTSRYDKSIADYLLNINPPFIS